MGPRTIDRGFDYAPVIVDGVLRQGVGGGICQFATTLFNAAFFAGLPIVERHPHDFYIDHYPVGRDAAVAWGSKDLKFRNDSGRTLMIRCWAGGGRLTIVIVGDTGRTVDYTTSGFTNVRKSPYTKAHPRVVYDGDRATGVVSWEKGYDGMTVKVNRTVLDNGRVLFRDSFISTYAPKDWIKRIGTG
jgi:vancomycin resistance protein YoaR